jgi:hypothetical protein
MVQNYQVVSHADPVWLRTQQINMLARISHDLWRSDKRVSGTPFYQTTMRPVNDAKWTQRHDGAETFDLANTDFADLPLFWQQENVKNAEYALNAVISLLSFGAPLNNGAVWSIAAGNHGRWAERRTDRSASDRDVFAMLPSAEQKKSLDLATWAVNMIFAIDIESRILIQMADASKPGGLGELVDGGVAPKGIDEIVLPDNAIGFRYEDHISVASAPDIKLVAVQSSLYLPGAHAVANPSARLRRRMGPILGPRCSVLQTRVDGVYFPDTNAVIPRKDPHPRAKSEVMVPGVV